MRPDDRLARRLICSRTGEVGDLDSVQFLSPVGAPWLVEYDLAGRDGRMLAARWKERPWSMWRYRELLPHRDHHGRVDLGEGGTPLVPLRRIFRRDVEVALKQEGGNPTGSFKDRGLSMAVNRASWPAPATPPWR
jgi:threonine synthase